MKNEVELTKKHFALNECYDKDTGNSSIPASRRMLWNKIEQLKQERQKVIAELEEWVDKKDFTTNVPCDLGCCELGKAKCVTSYQLKQKLKEMKGE